VPPRDPRLRLQDIVQAVDRILARCPDVPWQDMRDMRNLLFHEYFGVSIRIVWDTIQRDLPSVSRALTVELARATDQG
jgi:uncharacterized protein with HEPN domain